MTSYLKLKNGGKIAYNKIEGASPGVMFLGGFRSDMNGVKALALENFCKKQGRAFIRFDYEGHGESSGDFEDCTIGRWKEDALQVLTKLTDGRQILVGSSMGGWLALLLAIQKPRNVAGIIGIAAAPDFTEYAVLQKLKKSQVKELQTKGQVMVASDMGDDYPITKRFIEEARQHLLLNKKIPIKCPVRLLHGTKDDEVPWDIAIRINERLESDDVKTILVENGSHTLSDPKELKKVLSVLDKMIAWLRV
ncbi:MAG TPA: alpha/beta hydrolase [Rickettsiales bacterium]|nr:alpha/beta hydrolase [Rickettsiales bacterium]